MKRLLFVGGTNFFGKLAVKKLLETGQYEVTVLTRGNKKVQEFEDCVTSIHCERTDSQALSHALQDKTFDVIVDNFAITKRDVQNILDIMRGRVGHYLFCSTGAVYPEHGQHEYTEAEAIFKAIPGQREYANHNREAEGILRTYQDVPYTVYRPTVIQGPGDNTVRTLYFVEKLYQQTPFYIPADVSLKHVYVDDVAEALVQLIEQHPHNQAYNLVGDDKISLQEYCEKIASLLNKPACYEIISQQEFLDRKIQDFPIPYHRSLLISNQKITQELGFKFTPIQKWLPITLEWCIEVIKNPEKGPAKLVY